MKKCRQCNTSYKPEYVWQIYCSQTCRTKYNYVVRTNKGRRNDILKKYGITEEDYLLQFDYQNGRCAICNSVEISLSNTGKATKYLAVDHNHITGELRGLLCARCNKCIGLTREDSDILLQMIVYLKNGGVEWRKKENQ